MSHFKVKPLGRFFTLLLTLTLALPDNALALRQLNAGSEEGRVDDALRERLLDTPAAGVEENVRIDLLPAAVAGLVRNLAQEYPQSPSFALFFVGPKGEDVLQLMMLDSLPDSWPDQISEVLERIGVTGAAAPLWKVTTSGLTPLSIAESREAVLNTPTGFGFSVAFEPAAPATSKNVAMNEQLVRALAQASQRWPNYPEVISAAGRVGRGEISLDQAVDQLVEQNEESWRTASRGIIVMVLMGAKHDLYALGLAAVEVAVSNPQIDDQELIKWLTNDNDERTPDQARAIIGEIRRLMGFSTGMEENTTVPAVLPPVSGSERVGEQRLGEQQPAGVQARPVLAASAWINERNIERIIKAVRTDPGDQLTPAVAQELIWELENKTDTELVFDTTIPAGVAKGSDGILESIIRLRVTGMTKRPDSAAGVEEKGVVVGGVSVPYTGMVLNWYSNEEGMVPSELLDILDPEQDRIAVPLADISSDTIVHIQKGVLSGRVIDALEAAGVRVVPFDDLEKIPQATSGKENVYILDVPNGSEREWILDSSSIVINLRAASLDNRPNSPEELGALINVARAADDKVLKVGFIYRSDLQNSVIALDTQL